MCRLIDLKFDAARDTDAAEVNGAMEAGGGRPAEGRSRHNEAPLVSIDFNHYPASSTFDLTQTQVIDGSLVRVLSLVRQRMGFLEPHVGHRGRGR